MKSAAGSISRQHWLTAVTYRFDLSIARGRMPSATSCAARRKKPGASCRSSARRADIFNRRGRSCRWSPMPNMVQAILKRSFLTTRISTTRSKKPSIGLGNACMIPSKNWLKPGGKQRRITSMKTATIEISQPAQSAADSSRRERAEARFRKLDEATLNALRQAGAARTKKEQEERELALRETQTPSRAGPK